MPAPAVIPAPIAYIIDVAVKTFVVELYLPNLSFIYDKTLISAEMMQTYGVSNIIDHLHFTLSESACSTQACALNDLP